MELASSILINEFESAKFMNETVSVLPTNKNVLNLPIPLESKLKTKDAVLNRLI